MIAELRALAASGRNDTQLARHFGVPRTTIEHHRRNNHIPNGYVRPNFDAVPDGFAEIAPTMTQVACAAHFNVSPTSARRWYAKTGAVPAARVYVSKPEKPVAPKRFWRPAGKPIAATLPQRDRSAAGRAQLFLQRFGPVHRASTVNPNATGWIMFGRKVSEEDLISTAVRKGFKLEAMAA